MDEIDQAFYDLVVAQRNAAWHENEKLLSRLAAIDGHIAKFMKATETVLERYDHSVTTVCLGNPFREDTSTEEVLLEIEQELNK